MAGESSEGEAIGEWRPDPTGRYRYRFWDGDRWSDRVSTFGVRSVDPMGAPADTLVSSPALGVPSDRAPEPSVDERPDDSRWTWIEGTGRAGAAVLAFGSLMILVCGFLTAARPPVGAVQQTFALNETTRGGDLIYPALLMLFLSVALFRSYPSRGVSWTVVVIATATMAYAIRIRSDVDHLLDASNYGTRIPVTSSLNLVIISAAVCLVGGLWCVRADGPIRRADTHR